MKRIIAIAAMPMLLGGCLPIPVTIASTAISGISYVKTGKFSTDHILSAFVEQDCVLTRPITGEAMCHDIDPGSEAAGERVIVAAYPGDRDTGNFRSNNDPEISLGAMKIDGLSEQPTLVAAAMPYAPPAPIETPGLAKIDGPSMAVLAVRKAVPAALPPVPIARPASISTASVSSIAVAKISTVSAPIEPWTPPASYTLSRGAPVAVSAATKAVADAAEKRYIVIGSVRDSDRAEALAARFADRKAQIRPIDVDGQTWHRVLVGPYGLQEARLTRADLGEVDGHQPWIVRIAPQSEQVAMR